MPLGLFLFKVLFLVQKIREEIIPFLAVPISTMWSIQYLVRSEVTGYSVSSVVQYSVMLFEISSQLNVAFASPSIAK